MLPILILANLLLLQISNYIIFRQPSCPAHRTSIFQAQSTPPLVLLSAERPAPPPLVLLSAERKAPSKSQFLAFTLSHASHASHTSHHQLASREAPPHSKHLTSCLQARISPKPPTANRQLPTATTTSYQLPPSIRSHLHASTRFCMFYTVKNSV